MGNFKGSFTRVITAFFLIPAVVLTVLYAGRLPLLAAVSAVIFLALREYNTLTGLKVRDSRLEWAAILISLLLPFSFYFHGVEKALPLLPAGLFLLFLVSMWRLSDFRDAFLNAAIKTAGIVYLALPLSFLIAIRDVERGGVWILFLLTIIWANDTFAYVTGRLIGRHKLSPMVSPGKTVEGVFGGLAGGVFAALVFRHFGLPEMGVLPAVIFSLVAGGIGVFGDLFESLIKRAAGAKDSGTIVPGHGGVLDRIDSLVFPIPLLYYYLTCFFNYAG